MTQPKALIPLAGKPLILRSLERFVSLDLVAGAVIVVPAGYLDAFRNVIDQAFGDLGIVLTEGGLRRQDSVINGLAKLDPTAGLVVIHDAARPFVSKESIHGAIQAANKYGAATVALPCTDTILKADEEDFLTDTPDRREVWACQTPQVFRVDLIREAHRLADKAGRQATDDASLVREQGHKVKLVPGTALNFKITRPEDLAYAEYLLQENLTS